MTKLTVVIAAYDEEENVETLTRRLHATLGAISDLDWGVLYVVEGRDRTREILEALAAELGRIRVLYQEEPEGLGNAFRRGFAAVPPDSDLVVTLDADLNHQPEEIARLLTAQRRRDCDILIGSRFLAGSSVEGAPLWKRVLSGGMNILMRYLYRLRVADKTSGFRVYRSAVLRNLHFSEKGFAFLPELLIRAHAAGYVIAEEPIRFVFRQRGESKLRFWTTSLSYLTLFRARFDRWSVAVLALLVAGAAVRAAAVFPLHKYPADADCVLTGLTALKILDGDLRVFFSGFRIGALESYVAAALFTVLGPSRLALALGPLFLNLLQLLLAHRFVRALCGRKIACLALLFLAIPPPAVLFWTYMPNGYPALFLLATAVLWLAARLARCGGGARTIFALGLAAGLCVWQSLLSLAVIVPSFGWLLLQRPTLLRRGAFAALVVVGGLVGAAPWLAFNARYQMPTFTSNFATRAAAGPEAVLDNAAHLVRYNLPELLAGRDPEDIQPPTALEAGLTPVVLLFHVAAALAFFALPSRNLLPPRSGERALDLRAARWLCGGVILAVALLNVFSQAGQLRGLTVRYVLPLYLIVPLVLGVALAAAGRWPLVAAGLAAAVVVLNVAGYPSPGGDRRERLRELAGAERQLVGYLERREIDVVLGGFWVTYPLNFVSRERVRAVPCESGHGHYSYLQGIQERHRWAFVAYRRGGEEWVRQAGVAGAVADVAGEYTVLIPHENPPQPPWRELFDTAAVACRQQPF